MRAEPALLALSLAVSPLYAAGSKKGTPAPTPRPSPAASIPRAPAPITSFKAPATPAALPGLEPGADGTYPGAGLTPAPVPARAAVQEAAKPAVTAAVLRARIADLRARIEALAPHLEAAAKGVSPRATGDKIEIELTTERRAEGAADPVPAPAVKMLGLASAELVKAPALAPASARPLVVPMTGQEFLNNPGDLYEAALEKAKQAAESRGWAPKDVHFGYATANMPVRNGVHWSFTFFVAKPVAYELNGAPVFKTAKSISVDFRRGITTLSDQFEPPRVEAWSLDGEIPSPLQPRLDGYVRKGFELSPEQALSRAQRFAPKMLGHVSVLARWQAEPVSGDVDMWYRFFDDLDHKVEVNARTGEARWIDKPVEPMTGAPFALAAATILLLFSGVVMSVLSLQRPDLRLWAAAAIALGGLAGWNFLRADAAARAKAQADYAKAQPAAAAETAQLQASPEPQPEPPAREPADGMRDGDVFAQAYRVAGWKTANFTQKGWEEERDATLVRLKAGGASKAQLDEFGQWVKAAKVWGGDFKPSAQKFDHIARLSRELYEVEGASQAEELEKARVLTARLVFEFDASEDFDYKQAAARAVISELKRATGVNGYGIEVAEVLAEMLGRAGHLRLQEEILEAVVENSRGEEYAARAARAVARAAASDPNYAFKDMAAQVLEDLRRKAPEAVAEALSIIEESRKKK